MTNNKVAYNKILTGVIASSILAGGVGATMVSPANAESTPTIERAVASTLPDANKYAPSWAQGRLHEGGKASLSAPAMNWEPTFLEASGYATPQNVTYEADTSSLPDYITITMAEDGSVKLESTIVALDNNDPVNYQIPVKVTYNDGSVDNVTIDFIFYPAEGNETVPTDSVETPTPVTDNTPENERYVPTYADGRVSAGGKAQYSAPAINWEEGYAGANGYAEPQNVKYALADSFTGIDGVTVTVNESTGEASVEASVSAPAGVHTIDVLVTYEDGSADTASVKLDIYNEANPPIGEPSEPPVTDPTEPPVVDATTGVVQYTYPESTPVVLNSDTEYTITPETSASEGAIEDADAGTSFRVDIENTTYPGGVTVDNNGVITIDTTGVPEGTYDVVVAWDYDNGETATAKTSVVVTAVTGEPPTTDPVEEATVTESDKYTPEYATVEIQTPGSGTLSAPAINWASDYDKAEGMPNAPVKKFALGEGYTAPDGVTVSVDETTGAISIEVANNASAGDYTIPVVVTYEDDSVDTVDVSFKVLASEGTTPPVDETPEPTPAPSEDTETPAPTPVPSDDGETPAPSPSDDSTDTPTDVPSDEATNEPTAPTTDAPISDNVTTDDTTTTPTVDGKEAVVEDDGRVTVDGLDTGLKVKEDGSLTYNGEEATVDEQGRVLVNGEDTGIRVAGNLVLDKKSNSFGTTSKGTPARTVTQGTANTGGDIDAGNNALIGGALASLLAGAGAFFARRKK